MLAPVIDRAGRLKLARLPVWLRTLTGAASLPDDSEELRLRKAVLLLSATLMAALASIWIVTYALLGLWLSAAIPFAYQLASAASIVVFLRTRRYLLFRRSQLLLSLMLPFALQWSLGGFQASSAVCLWAFTSALGAMLFVGGRAAIPWFGAFAALLVLSAIIDSALAERAADIPSGVGRAFFVLNILGVTGTASALLQYFVHAREIEQARSERLLLNVLPAPVAARLKRDQGVIADQFESVTVLFADIAGFTPLAQHLPAAELVELLDGVFARWDVLVADLGLEKIKTIGDAYMVAGGVPLAHDRHVAAVADLALAMGPALDRCAADMGVPLALRIGIDSGPVIAGVIGRTKFIYDLWGDTVNTASRMESHGDEGLIQVTDRARRALEPEFELYERGVIDVKGKGPMTCHVLTGRRDARPASSMRQ